MERLLLSFSFFTTARERDNSVWQSPKGTAVQATKSHYSRALRSQKWKTLKTADLVLPRKPWNMKHRSEKQTIQHGGGGWEEGGGGRTLIETNKHEKKREREREKHSCDLSLNSAELKMHPLSHWRAGGVKDPRRAGEHGSAVLLVVGGAFRVPFSITPRWATLKKTPKEKKTKNRTRLEHQVDPTARAIFWKCLWRL